MKRITLIFIAAVLGISSTLVWAKDNAGLRNQLQVESSPPERTGPLAGYADVVEKIAPSVVSIVVSKKADALPVGVPDMFNDPLFREFFGGRIDPRRLQPRERGDFDRPQPREQGMGSGVIITSDGYIATNNHVVEGADKIEVHLPGDRETYEGKIIGTDPATDVALIKIDGQQLPTATIGDSSQLKPGDTVLAVGNPFGLSETVTTGIVSAIGRNNLSITDYGNFIQTDASINPGNSGGALVDNKGRVIGINTAIFTRSGGNQGIGFAIPVNQAVDIMDRLLADGEIQRGFLGVTLSDLTPDLARGFGVSAKGALVNEVIPDTPAAKAGIQEGDVITAYNGEEVDNMAELRLRVANTRPNTKADFEIVRNGKEKTVAVEIGLLPKADGLAANAQRRGKGWNDESKSGDLLPGLEVADLSESTRAAYGVPANVSGVVVTEVDPNSAAAEAGIRKGDVITSVAREEVASVADALEARHSFKGDVLLLRVVNAEGSRFLAVEVS